MTWAIYTRVSTRHQAEDGFSLQNQRERLVAYAEDRGWDYEVFEDAGESGEKLEKRPALVRLLDLASAGEINGVLVTDESRLARDELTAAVIRDRLKKTDTKLATLRGEHDLTDASENFVANVLAAAHAFEQDLRTEKMKSGLRKAAESGYWPGGPAPYGYDLVPAADGSKHKQLAIKHDEAAVLREVVDLIINQGHTTYSVATYLNDKGIRTRRGRLWRHPNLCHQLRQERLTGRWIYNLDGQEIEAKIPAILSPDTWAQLQANIKGTARPQRKNRLYPLSGRGRHHLFCQCGSNLFGMIRKEKNRRAYYTCSRAHHSFGDERCGYLPRTHQAIPLENAVWKEISTILTDADRLSELAAAYITEQSKIDDQSLERTEIQLGLDQLNRQQTRIVRDLADRDQLGLVDSALQEIAEERTQLEFRLAEIDKNRSTPAISRRQLEQLATQAQQRMNEPSPELMAEIFELLDVTLHRVGPDRFEGTGTIPIHEPPVPGELWKETPRRPSPPRQR